MKIVLGEKATLQSSITKHVTSEELDSLRKEFRTSKSLLLTVIKKEVVCMLTAAVTKDRSSTESLWEAQAERKILLKVLGLFPED